MDKYPWYESFTYLIQIQNKIQLLQKGENWLKFCLHHFFSEDNQLRPITNTLYIVLNEKTELKWWRSKEVASLELFSGGFTVRPTPLVV